MKLKQLKKELKNCKDLWSKYSYDCLAFEIKYLENQIIKHSKIINNK